MNNPMEKQRCLNCGVQVFRPDAAYVMGCKVCDLAKKEGAKAERKRLLAMHAQLSVPTKENLPLVHALAWLDTQFN